MKFIGDSVFKSKELFREEQTSIRKAQLKQDLQLNKKERPRPVKKK